MSTEIRLLNTCRTLLSDGATSSFDAFDSIGVDWTPDATVGWSLDGVVTSGIVVAGTGAQAGKAITSAYSLLNTACFDKVGVGAGNLVSTTKYREVFLEKPNLVVDGSEISILMDMDATTPLPAASVRMRVWVQLNASGTYFYEVRLYVNGAHVFGTNRPYTTQFASLAMSIDSTKRIRCYASSATVPDIVYQASGYNPVGGRVGFGLKSGATAKTSVDSFTYRYTLAQVGAVSSADLPPRMLVASANSRLAFETKDGSMVNFTSATTTLASDRLLSSVNRLTNLYIADYGLAKHGTGGQTNAGAGTTFSDGSVGSWSTLGVNATDYRLEVLAGPPGITIGIYAITGISGASLTLATTPGVNLSSITYRVLRGQKVLISGLLTSSAAFAMVPLGAIGAIPGQYPIGCTIVAAWDDRILWSGDPLFPHVVYMSKQGDPNNYLYANETEGEAFAYDPARVAGASQIGDAVTAIIPHSHDYCIFAGYRSFSIQRGDPTIGGALDLISREVGIVDKHAWCYTPEQVILGLSPDGLYLFQPSPDAAPQRVSRERLPAELLDINTAQSDVQMAYDIENQGAILCITPKVGGPGTYWFFDWGKKAFWPETYQSWHEPTAMCVHTLGGSSVPSVVFGGRDGYLRQFADSSGMDDGSLIPSTALLGPFMLGSPQFHGLLHRLWLELDSRSGSVNVDVLMGDTPERARNSLPAYSFLLSQRGDAIGPQTEIVRARGGACFVRLSGLTNLPWALESGAMEREMVGERRNY